MVIKGYLKEEYRKVWWSHAFNLCVIPHFNGTLISNDKRREKRTLDLQERDLGF
jgi:hypothetical protein